MTVHTASAVCHCGNLFAELAFTDPPASYRPRVCDCDFCRMHGAAYVSDPTGSVLIGVRDPRELVKHRHGSGSADFLLCRTCGVLVAILYREAERLYATVNAAAVAGGRCFGVEQSVSPKRMSASEKAGRWRELWFADVKLVNVDPLCGADP